MAGRVVLTHLVTLDDLYGLAMVFEISSGLGSTSGARPNYARILWACDPIDLPTQKAFKHSCRQINQASPAPQRNESPPRSVRRAGDLLGLAAAAGGNTNLIG